MEVDQDLHRDLTKSLPKHIWTVIASHLPSLPDFIRFGAVCKLFRSATSSSPHPIRPLSWFLLPPPNRSLSFFSLNEQKTYSLPPLPESLSDSHCATSSHGWLIFVDPTLRVHLFHPFSRTQYLLPPFPPSPITLRESVIHKAALSSNPEDDGIVVAIHGSFGKLFSCRVGSISWSPIPDHLGNNFCDLLHFRGRFYATSSLIGVAVCNLDSDVASVSVCLGRNLGALSLNYLFDLDGELVFVQRERVLTWTHDGAQCTTLKIHVLKMDSESGEWAEIDSIGGRSLFLNQDQVVPLPVGEFPVCEKGFIYFADNSYCFGVGVGGIIRYVDMGMCELKSGRILPLALEQRETFKQLLVSDIYLTPILHAARDVREVLHQDD